MISSENKRVKGEETIQIMIQDDGAGIDSADLIHVFDPFFTTRSNGSGLGLSIAYSIIEMHQGTIKVESEIGKGTKMLILLPVRRNRKSE